MGAIVVSCLVSVIAIVGVIYFYCQEKREKTRLKIREKEELKQIVDGYLGVNCTIKGGFKGEFRVYLGVCDISYHKVEKIAQRANLVQITSDKDGIALVVCVKSAQQ